MPANRGGRAYAKREDGWVLFTFQYDPYLVDNIKFELPRHARWWNAQRRSWSVKEAFLSKALAVFAKNNYRVIWSDNKAPKGVHPRSLKPHEVLHVTEDAPQEVIKAAYRALSQINHPDRGGDEAKMKEINSAYEAMKR